MLLKQKINIVVDKIVNKNKCVVLFMLGGELWRKIVSHKSSSKGRKKRKPAERAKFCL